MKAPLLQSPVITVLFHFEDFSDSLFYILFINQAVLAEFTVSNPRLIVFQWINRIIAGSPVAVKRNYSKYYYQYNHST